jgi:hypothetical protein
MTTTVQMNTGLPGNGTVGLPGAPSGASYAMTNGIVSVNPVDVPTAIRIGWQVQAGQNLAAVLVTPMKIPTVGAWSAAENVTFPDGSTATITAGVANIPAAWVNWASQLGWTT